MFYLTRTLAAFFLAFKYVRGFLHAMWLVWLFGALIAFSWRYKPYYLTGVDTSWNQHKIEMFNCIVFYYLIMATVLFTELVPDAQLQYTFGWFWVFLLAAALILVLANLVQSILWKVVRKK